MSKFSKNEIISLDRDLKVGDIEYKQGQRFVVAQKTPLRLTITMLNNDGSLNAKQLSGKPELFHLFSSTNTKYAPPKADTSDIKKGNVYTFKKPFENEQVSYPVGARAILVKGGARPEFFSYHSQKNKMINGLIVTPEFIETYFELSEPVKCDLTDAWEIKGLKQRQGEETPNFEFNLYHNGKKVGGASNDGYGGSHRIGTTTDAWDKLVDEAFKVVKSFEPEDVTDQMIISRHNIEEAIVDFFLEGVKGLITLKDYLQRYSDSWYEMTKKYSRKK